MAEYIERERAIQKVKNVIATEWFQGNYEAIGPLQRVVDVQLGRMTAADVAQVVHARWEMKSEDTTPGIYHVKKAFCTRCGKSNKHYRPPYCPHCGANMDEEEHDNNV